jgi:hypothetical protein
MVDRMTQTNHMSIWGMLVLTPLLTCGLLCRTCKNSDLLCSELLNLVIRPAIFFGCKADVFQDKCPDLVDISVVLYLSIDLRGCVDFGCQYLRNNAVEMMKYLDCQRTSDAICIYQVVERLGERFPNAAGTIELIVFGIHCASHSIQCLGELRSRSEEDVLQR